MTNKIRIVFILLLLPFLVSAQTHNDSKTPKAGIVPGSTFYFLDKFGEKMQEIFTFSPEAKVRLQVSLVAERTAEINELLGTEAVDSEAITTARISLEEHNGKILKIIDKEIKKEKNVDTLYIERDRSRELTNSTINLIGRLKQEKRMTEEEQKQHRDQGPTRDNHTITLSPTHPLSKSPSPTSSSRPPIPSPKQTSTPNYIEPRPNASTPTITLNSSSLKSQFLAIEEELTAAKNSKSVLSMTHYEQIKKDLDSLKSQGYAASEVDRLQKLAIELTPEIADQNKPVSTTPTQEPCVNSRPQLTADFTDFSKIQKITAPGSSSSEGPKGHSFIWTNSQRVPIYAPADAILESGAYSRDTEDSPNQYNLTFDIKGSCFKFRLDHIDEPIDTIRSVLPSTPKVADSRGTAPTKVIEFKAGDLIGYTKGNIPSGNWDFGLYDMSKEGTLAQYGSYGLHRHSVCWPDYYSTDKYKKLLEGPKLVCP